MPFNSQVTEELNILARYNLTTTQEGLKIHSSAGADVIAATQRLYDKGLLTQADGGYLTDLGRNAAEQTQSLLLILQT